MNDNQEILAVGQDFEINADIIHGPSGSGDMLYGSRDCFAGTIAWQVMQLVMMSLFYFNFISLVERNAYA